MTGSTPISRMDGSPEKGGDWHTVGLSVFLIIIVLAPFAIVILAFETEPYHVIPGEPVKDSLAAAGITVTETKEKVWEVPGATGGKTYVLSDNAGNTVTITTQAFDSAESRDAAVRQYHTSPVGRGKPVGDLLISGQYLVYVTPINSPVMKEVAALLKSAGRTGTS